MTNRTTTKSIFGPARAFGRAPVVAGAVLVAGLASFASADDEPGKVPFEKPPYAVECFEKTKIGVKGTKDNKGLLKLDIKANAYYPDGTEYYLTARHSKQDQVFARVKAVVQKHAFTATFGPFPTTVPGGEIVVDAWFDFVAQPGPIKVLIWPGDAHGSRESENYKKGYFHCPNGCKYDKKNLVIGKFENGGHDAQVADEALEKAKFGELRQAILDARKNKKPGLAAAASVEKSFTDLDADIKAAQETFSKWKQTRLFLFFPKTEENLAELTDAVTREGKIYMAKAGIKNATTAGITGNFEEMLTSVSKEIEDKADSIKGFLSEKDSLDKMWEEHVQKLAPGAMEEVKKTGGDKKAKEQAGGDMPPPSPPK